MKKTILTILGVAASFAAFGQGTFILGNNVGATIYPVLLPSGAKATGAQYSVEVFARTMDPANKIGPTLTLGSNGRFAVAGNSIVPGAAVGSIATLIVRAWDNTGGATWDTAVIKGFTTFQSDVLGGDADGDPSTPPAVAKPMVNGKPDGFQNIQLTPEPSTIALAALGAAALFLRRRK